MANWWELSDYEESGSLGYDPDTFVQGQTMLYGMEDLHSLFTNLQDLYGDDSAEAYAPQAYDISREDLIRDSYKESYKDYRRSLTDLSRSTMGELYSANVKSGKSGFAGGGSASRRADTLSQSYMQSVASARKQFQSSKLGYEESIYDQRKGYVDDLWSKYGTYLIQADNPIEVGDWDQWNQNVLPDDPDPYDCPEGMRWDTVTVSCVEDTPPTPFN